MAVAAVDLGFFRAQPCWTADDKEQLLEALWAAHEKARVAQNVKQCRYKSRRYAEDEHFRERVNKVSAACKRRKSHCDPIFREKVKERARVSYRQKKLAKLPPCGAAEASFPAVPDCPSRTPTLR